MLRKVAEWSFAVVLDSCRFSIQFINSERTVMQRASRVVLEKCGVANIPAPDSFQLLTAVDFQQLRFHPSWKNAA
jgi:hypothetical protein